MNFFLGLRNYRGFLLRDLGSKHGTFVNCKRIGVKDGSSRNGFKTASRYASGAYIALCFAKNKSLCWRTSSSPIKRLLPERTAADNAECEHDAAAEAEGQEEEGAGEVRLPHATEAGQD